MATPNADGQPSRRFRPKPKAPRQQVPKVQGAGPVDHIQVLPPQQLIPVLQPGETQAPGAEPPAGPALERQAQLQRREIEQQHRREAELQRRRERREHEASVRQDIIQKWQRTIEREEQECSQWALQGEDRSIEASLGRQLAQHWTSTRPSPRQEEKRSKIVRDVQSCITKAWPRCALEIAPFGSSVTGIVTATSDIDLALLDPSRPFGVGTPPEMRIRVPGLSDEEDGADDDDDLPSWYDVRNVAKALRRYGGASPSRQGRPLFTQVFPITGANVPIVKFKDLDTGLSGDISVNDRFGRHNSGLIKAYATLRQQTFRPLCFAVKHWLKRRKLNDPSGEGGQGSSLSSYSIVLLVIQYLQIQRLLPSLQNDALLASQGIPRNYIFRAPKLPRRRAGDPRPGSTTDARRPEATRYDVTYLDTSVPEHSGIRDGGWTYYLRAGDEEQARLAKEVSKERWDQERAAHPEKFGNLPCAADVGLHRSADASGEDPTTTLGQDFIGFIQWYSSLSKRDYVIDVKHGAPRKSNTIQTRRAWQEANGLGDGIPRGVAASESSSSDSASSSSSDGEQLLIPGAEQAPRTRARDHDPDQPLEWESDRIVIRDPFILDRNTAKNIHRVPADRIDVEFSRAVRMIEEGTIKKESVDLPVGEVTGIAPGPLLLSQLCLPYEYVDALSREEQEKARVERREKRVAAATAAAAAVQGEGEGGASEEARAAFAAKLAAELSSSDLDVELDGMGLGSGREGEGKAKKSRRGRKSRGGNAPGGSISTGLPARPHSRSSDTASLALPPAAPFPRAGGARGGSSRGRGGLRPDSAGYSTTGSSSATNGMGSSFGRGRGRGRGGGGKFRNANRSSSGSGGGGATMAGVPTGPAAGSGM